MTLRDPRVTEVLTVRLMIVEGQIYHLVRSGEFDDWTLQQLLEYRLLLADYLSVDQEVSP